MLTLLLLLFTILLIISFLVHRIKTNLGQFELQK